MFIYRNFKTGSTVRLRIMGVTIDAGSITAIGTIKDDYLGLLTGVDY
jgi:DNA-directed RNA polymerase subunit E'/Rpb7